MSVGIVTAGGGHAWEAALVSELAAHSSAMTVLRRCPDVADILATATTGQVQICVVAADLPQLDSVVIDQLAQYGAIVAVVYRDSDQRIAGRLSRIGVTCTISDDSEPAAMIEQLRQALSTVPQDHLARGEDRHYPVAEPRWALPIDADTREQTADAAQLRGRQVDPDGHDDSDPSSLSSIDAIQRQQPGEIWAVWGATGSPGRTTVAINVATHAAEMGRSVLLIDGDVYGGVVASALGLLDESAGLAGACRLAGQGLLDANELGNLCFSVMPRLTVLTGIARADRWPEIRPTALESVLDIAREVADVIVIDCASILEADEELSFDTLAPRRNGATLAFLHVADRVLAVGAADTLGVQRLVRALIDYREISDETPTVVLNRVRSTAPSKSELTAALERFTAATPHTFLPYDSAACDKAWRDGATLTAAAPRSDLTKSIGHLSQQLLARNAAAHHREAVPR